MQKTLKTVSSLTSAKTYNNQMGKTSKDLLHLEHKSSASSLESALLVCKKDKAPQANKPKSDGKPITAPLAKSEVLGKVRDFLGVMSEDNKRLELAAKENSEKYDIEALTGNESEVIEMDLMLGLADLNTPEALAAAESAVARGQSVLPLAASSSDTDSEESSDEDDDYDSKTEEDDNDGDKSSDSEDDVNDKKMSPGHFKRPKSSGTVEGKKSKKRPKIVELS